MADLDNPGSGWKVDGFTVIEPSKALVGVVDSTNFHVHAPFTDHLGGSPFQTFQLAGSTGLAHAVFHPFKPQAMYLQPGSNVVWQADMVTGRSTEFATVPEGERLVYGGSEGRLFVLQHRGLVSLDPSGQVLQQIDVPIPLDAFDYDPVRNRMVALSRAAGQLLYYDLDLRPLGGDPLPPLAGDGRINLSIDLELWAHADGSPIVTAMSYDSDGQLVSREVALQTTAHPSGLFVDPRGVIFVSESGTLREYALDGSSSQLSPFAGLRGGDVFAFTRDYSNYDPAVHGIFDFTVDDWASL